MISSLVTASALGLCGFGLVYLLLRLVTIPASVRCWLWRLVLLKFAVGLFFVFEVPLLHAPATITALPEISLSDSSPTSGTLAQAPESFNWNLVFLSIWAAGAIAAISSRKWRVPREPQGEIIGDLTISDSATAPYVAGLLRPQIIVPSGLNGEELELVLLHEKAHLARRDLQWSALLTLVACTFWFLPPVWWSLRWSKEEAEIACDEIVVNNPQVSTSAYARLLLRFAGAHTPRPALAMATSTRLIERRLLAMKKRAKTRLWVLALIPAMLSLLPWVAVAQRAGTEGATQQADHLLLDYTHLIGKPEVKKELGITAQQLDELVRAETQSNKLIRDLGNRLEELKASGKSAQEMGKYNEVERPKTFAAMHQLYLDVLTASQRKRLKEIALQHIGGRALLYTDIQSALGVSPEQQKRIAKTVAIFREGMDRTRKAHDSAFRDNFRNPRAINALPPQEMAEYARIENELPVASGARKTELLIRKRALEDKVGYHKTFDEQKRKQLEKEWAVREQEFKVKWDKILSEQGRALMNELSLWQKSRLKDLQGKPLFIQ